MGGNVGDPDSGAVESSYYDRDTSGKSDTTQGSAGLSTEDMKRGPGVYTGWNFTNTWDMQRSKNDGYPHLRENDPDAPNPTKPVTPGGGCSTFGGGASVLLLLLPLAALAFGRK